jgi:hypothetical protein
VAAGSFILAERGPVVPRYYYYRSSMGVFFRWLRFFVGLFLVASALGWLVSHVMPLVVVIAVVAAGSWLLLRMRG